MVLVHGEKWAVEQPRWALRRGVTWLMNRLQAWHREASDRRYLTSLNDHNLKDLGLSRHDVDRDAMSRDRFW
jgi:uncharacterized protein YjiS (DUF1127 family)